MMSSTMGKATSAAQRGLGNTTRSVATLERHMRMLERRRNLSIDTRDISRANREIQNLQTRINGLKGGGASGGSMFGAVVGGNLAASGIAAGGSALGSIFNAGLQGQQQKASLEVMAGQANGAQLFKDLNKFAQESIFGNEVFQAAQTMKAFGIETERVMPTLKMLGDISMGDKEKLNSLTLAFSQIKATGRLMGQDLLQLVNAGFNPLQIMSVKTGIGMADLKKKLEDGQISFKMVEDAFITATSKGGQFYDMTNKIAQTDFGKVQAAMGQIQGLALRIGTMLAPAVGNFIDNYGVPFLNLLDRTATWVQQNSGWLTPLAIGITGLIVGYKSMAVASALWAGAQTILNIALSLNPIGLIIGAIIGLIAVIGYVVSKTDGWGKMWQHTVNGAKLLWEGFTAHAKWNFETMVNGILIGLDLIKKGWYSFANAAGIGRKADNNAALARINADMEARKNAVVNGAKNVANLYQQSGAEFAAAAKSLSWKGGSMSQTVSGLRSQLTGGGTKGSSGTSLDALSSGGANGITGGGAKSIVVNINKEMFGSLSINSVNVKEGVGEMEQMIKEAVFRVFYSLESAQ